MDGNMQVGVYNYNNTTLGYEGEEDNIDIRKGPWTAEEDQVLTNYIHIYGEGRWNSLARCAGLKRTGKSCRLRWLNYLRPDVRRGNISLQEQLLILKLHTQWGNRWSKIAQYLPGRTDNEIKNYWRTRVQKQAKQLKCDVNSIQFRETMCHVWIPRLAERIRAESGSSTAAGNDVQTSDNNVYTGYGQDSTYCYKSDGSSDSTSCTTQISPLCSSMADVYTAKIGNQFAFGPCSDSDALMDSIPNGGSNEGMDFEYQGANQEQTQVENNTTWSDDDIYDNLDAWLGVPSDK